ncbi:MAG: acetyl-CoA carboxylase biotin carboxylase subunit family protein [Phycisphaerae bacterium]|jgi:biotin carboxylase
MSSRELVLVVGTTCDYVEHLRETSKGEVLFLTDISFACDSEDDLKDELFCDLSSPKDVLRFLKSHLAASRIRLTGITCYDCESLRLASFLAESLSLPYPSRKAIAITRDKQRSKEFLAQAGVSVGRFARVSDMESALEFFNACGEDIVLKPVSGSGSEYVFRCNSEQQLKANFAQIMRLLTRRSHCRMYEDFSGAILAEKYYSGREFSCDAIWQNGETRILRLTEKFHLTGAPLGTTRGYIYPAQLPEHISLPDITRQLHKAAEALGLSGVIFMTDFLATEQGIVLLEITPRPGGDCLPALLRCAAGFDVISAAVNVAEGQSCENASIACARHIGLRIFARNEGLIKNLDFSALEADARVLDIEPKRQAGDIVALPPKSYDKWLLANVIFRPNNASDFMEQCDELTNALHVDIEEMEL